MSGVDATSITNPVEVTQVIGNPIQISCKFKKKLLRIALHRILNNQFFFISDVTNVYGQLFYWVEWANGGKFVNESEVLEKWPRLMYDYLESKVQFCNPTGLKKEVDGKRSKSGDYFIGKQMGEFFILLLFLYI